MKLSLTKLYIIVILTENVFFIRRAFKEEGSSRAYEI